MKERLEVLLDNDSILLTNSKGKLLKFKNHINIKNYNKITAFHINDGRSNIVILYDHQNIIAKQCNDCGELLSLIMFIKNSSGYGNCRSKCKACTKNKISRTNKIPLSILLSNNTISIYESRKLLKTIVNINEQYQLHNLKAIRLIIENKKIDIVILYNNNEIEYKQCNDCKEIIHIFEFHKNKRGYGNTHPKCRNCRNKTTVIRNKPIYLKSINNLIVKHKECSRCKELVPLEGFKDGHGPGNKVSICKNCYREWFQEYRLQNLDLIKIKAKKRYIKNSLLIKTRMKNYYENNKVEAKKRVKEWRKKNILKVKSYQLNYEAKKKALKNTLTEDEILQIMEHFSFSCALSGYSNIEYDHFVCINTGHCGTYQGNIIPLESGLNCRKSDKNPFEWITDFPEYLDSFNKLVNYLAEQNNLTVKEYKLFVYWCYNNPRNLSDIISDDRDSLEIWKSEVLNTLM